MISDQEDSNGSGSDSGDGSDSSEQAPCVEVDRALELLAAVGKGDQAEVSRLARLVFSSPSLAILNEVASKANDAMLDLRIIGRSTYGTYQWGDLHDMGEIRTKALQAAAQKNSLPMFRALLQTMRQPAIDVIYDAFEMACRKGSVPIVEYLIKHHEKALRGTAEQTIPSFRQALAGAVEGSQAAVIEILLSTFPVDVNTSFDYLTPNCDGPYDYEDTAHLFVYPRMDVGDMCMLEHAVYSPEVLRVLMAHGLDVNGPIGSKKQHVLVKCCETYLCPIEVPRMLLDCPELNVDEAVVLDALEKGNRTDKGEVRALIVARTAKKG